MIFRLRLLQLNIVYALQRMIFHNRRTKLKYLFKIFQDIVPSIYVGRTFSNQSVVCETFDT